MPVLVDYARCNHQQCYPIEACPQAGRALRDDGSWIVAEAELCGDCPGPCVNLCDRQALRYAPNLTELSLLQAQLDGNLTPHQAGELLAARKAAAKQQWTGALSGINPVSEADFADRVLTADVPAIVEFWAPWCAPCRHMAPVFEQLAAGCGDSFAFFTVNSDAELALIERYGVTSIPSVLFFWEGREVDRVTGMLPASTLPLAFLKRWLEETTQRLLEGPGSGAARPSGRTMEPGTISSRLPLTRSAHEVFRFGL